jgi:redox-sensitive bicupin YhaK (pirin superfamily)
MHGTELTKSDIPLRRLARIQSIPAPEPGFAGPGHTAAEIISPSELASSDPFVLLMDDRLDFTPGRKVGGPHPHAGLETVTFVLEGTLADRDEGLLHSGDVAWMTAGSGIIHNEDVRVSSGLARVLQLWITLPEKQRAARPRFDVIRRDAVPVYRAPGVEARLYSGTSNGLRSPTINHVPVTLIDLLLEGGHSFEHELNASYNGFLLPLAGSLRVASEAEPLAAGQLGWLDRRDGEASTVLRVTALSERTRVLLYAGRRQSEPTVHRGPFVAGSPQALARMYEDYSAGRFPRVSEL